MLEGFFFDLTLILYQLWRYRYWKHPIEWLVERIDVLAAMRIEESPQRVCTFGQSR